MKKGLDDINRFEAVRGLVVAWVVYPAQLAALLKSGVCDDSAHASWHLEAHTAASAVKARHEDTALDVLHLPHVQPVWLDVVAGGEVALDRKSVV